MENVVSMTLSQQALRTASKPLQISPAFWIAGAAVVILVILSVVLPPPSMYVDYGPFAVLVGP